MRLHLAARFPSVIVVTLLTLHLANSKFFGNANGTKAKPQQSTLAFDGGRAQQKAAKHDIAQRDGGMGKPALADGDDKDVEMEDEAEVKPKVENRDGVDDEVSPDSAGTAHYPPVPTCLNH